VGKEVEGEEQAQEKTVFAGEEVQGGEAQEGATEEGPQNVEASKKEVRQCLCASMLYLQAHCLFLLLRQPIPTCCLMFQGKFIQSKNLRTRPTKYKKLCSKMLCGPLGSNPNT